MSWFNEFIKECWMIYHKGKGLGDMIKEISNYEIGLSGENHVEKKLKELKFITGKSPLSHTPADVWGFKHRTYFYHLSLFQVKTSLSANLPVKLNDSDKAKFKEFAKFVKEQFNKSDLVTEDFKEKSLAVSFGYIGVIIGGSKERMSYKIFEPSYFGYLRKNIPDSKLENVLNLVKALHEKDIC
jgi:hypothetical protein